ncbi:hypothetical protein [Aeromicrobium sp. CnD17-E]|uniref:DUF6896 domain-containing protein n=1 Tax=Aeromicrobium sp. CnD17-E TaxID=2954487 RepID=UPI00209706A7|nr:hypothetical protein [Aeromicrobium sp. CnD17-E]MCO7239089.1 hypothetical protein [Aeromicrobium sp. CnD17-E]
MVTSGEHVEGFLQLASRCLDALVLQFKGLDRPTVWTGLFAVPRDGTVPVRSGRLEGLGTFILHGRGCRFELDSGRDLSVDWDGEGRLVLDAWQVLMYARSAGDEHVQQKEIAAALRAVPVLRQIDDVSFTWMDDRYDLTPQEARTSGPSSDRSGREPQ